MNRVLIVDDEEHIRDLIGEMLVMGGYNCTLAATALEAREILKKMSFELVLCDITMPGESGLDFIQFVVAAFPETATVMITAITASKRTNPYPTHPKNVITHPPIPTSSAYQHAQLPSLASGLNNYQRDRL